MEFKKFLIVLSITISILVGIMFGASYSWYAYQNAETRVGGSTKKEAPSVVFAQTEYIFSKVTQPILDEDRYNYANKNSFTITLGDNVKDYQTGIEISLKDILMAPELRNANYKYELLQDGETVAKGDFSNLGSTTVLRLLPMTILNPVAYPTTYTYELYIWLSDDGSNQNELMNKVFSAKISVNSAVKR